VLAQHVGPIAKVMAKKAAGRTGDAQAFFVLLADNLPEGPARAKLLAELQKLG
jgi:serine/threonine-protein kinase